MMSSVPRRPDGVKRLANAVSAAFPQHFDLELQNFGSSNSPQTRPERVLLRRAIKGQKVGVYIHEGKVYGRVARNWFEVPAQGTPNLNLTINGIRVLLKQGRGVRYLIFHYKFPEGRHRASGVQIRVNPDGIPIVRKASIPRLKSVLASFGLFFPPVSFYEVYPGSDKPIKPQRTLNWFEGAAITKSHEIREVSRAGLNLPGARLWSIGDVGCAAQFPARSFILEIGGFFVSAPQEGTKFIGWANDQFLQIERIKNSLILSPMLRAAGKKKSLDRYKPVLFNLSDLQ